MAGYPCCCNVAPACYESDNFNGRIVVNSPTGAWCNSDSGPLNCTTQPAPTFGRVCYINSDGKLVIGGGTTSYSLTKTNISNIHNQYDTSVKISLKQNAAYAEIANLRVSRTNNSTNGSFYQWGPEGTTGFFGFIPKYIVASFSPTSEFSVRVAQCSGSVDMTGTVLAKGYIDGTLVRMGIFNYGSTFESIPGTTTAVGYGSGNVLEQGSMDGFTTTSGTFDDYTIQYHGGTGCPPCSYSHEAYPPFPASSVTLVMGGWTNCAAGPDNWSALNGSFSLSSASNPTGIICGSFHSANEGYRACKTWEYSGSLLNYTANPGCSGSPTSHSITKLRVTTYTNRRTPHTNPVVAIQILNEADEQFYTWINDEFWHNRMEPGIKLFCGISATATVSSSPSDGRLATRTSCSNGGCCFTFATHGPTGCELFGFRETS